jgi:tetratricopeptide (TPR) repeat protein
MAAVGPGASVGWLRAGENGLAGCAFLIGPDIALTCAHVVGAHLDLPKPVPREPPTGAVTIRFEALQDEVTGRVISGGWFSNAPCPPGELSDIAVVRLDKSLKLSPLSAIAQRMPTQQLAVVIHGAGPDYTRHGQQVHGKMSGGNTWTGRRQIDPENPAGGFTVEGGFSGSTVLDDLGNVVWGMIVAVAEQGTKVAYAIPADDLWAAIRCAGVEATARLPDATDRLAEEALATATAKVRAQYEAQLAVSASEVERMRQELDQFRAGVRGLEQEARAPSNEAALAALHSLGHGDVLPATEILRRRMEERLAAAGEARDEAAAAARQLGTMLNLIDAAGALKALHQAARCDPEDFWNWIEIARLEQIAGTLDGAMKAIDAALQAVDEDEDSRAVALNGRGDICLSMGDLAAALTSYQASLDIFDRLAKADPGNAGWQRDLALSHGCVAMVEARQGARDAALGAFHQGRDIIARLMRQSPDNATLPKDLAWFDAQIAALDG